MPAFHTSLFTRRRLAWALSLVLLFLVITVLLLPLIARPLLVDALRDKLQRPVTIEQLAFNPFTLSARLKGVAIGEPDGKNTLLTAQELFVNLQARSLWVGAPVIEEVELRQPILKLVRKQDGSYNISDLIELFSKPSGPPARYSLNNLQLQGGRIEFDDQPMGAKHVVSELDIAVPFLSNLPYATNILVKPQLSARIDGAPFKLAGQSLPFSPHHETTVELALQDIDLPGWLRYSPVQPGFKLASAKLQAKLALAFQQPDQGGPVVKLSGTAELHDVSATEPNGKPLLAFKRLAAELTSANLAERRVALRGVTLEQPNLHLVREKTGKLNLVRALTPTQAQGKAQASAPAAAAGGEAAWRVDLDTLQVKGGALQFNDLTFDQAFQTHVKDIALTVKEFSTRADSAFSLEASLATDAGESLRNSARIRLQPFEAQGTAGVSRLDLKRYAPYYRVAAGMGAEQGLLDISTTYKYQSGTTPQLLLTGLVAKLDALRLRKEGERAEFLRVGSLDLKGGELDLAKRSVKIESLATRDGNVFLAVGDDGQLRLTQVEQPTGRARRARATAAHPATATGPAPAAKPESSASPKAAAAPWRFSVKSLAVDGYNTRLDSISRGRSSSLAVNAITLRGHDVSNHKGESAKLELQARLGNKGYLRAGGQMAIEPLDLRLQIDARGLSLVPLQPWFTNKLSLTLTDGAVGVHGRLRLAQRPDSSLRYAFKGDAGVYHLATLDKQSAEEFLKWQSLRLRQIDASSEPTTRLSIGEVALTDFTTRLVINPDGSFNYQDVVAREAQAVSPDAGSAAKDSAPASKTVTDHKAEAQLPAKAASTAAKPQIQIGKVVLQGGHVNFQDHFIQPNYSAELTQLAGSISGLSSDPGMLAEVAIKGRVENQGQLDITGKVNPLSGNLFLDLLARLRDFELSPLSPYAAKYAGYGIEKGKMSFDVHYRVQDRKLSADNKLVLNQLTFGEHVDSPSATKLPVQLAVALLKDRNGNINLDLPISGSLDDPQFSVGGIIVKAIFNLIGRAITAPFSLIAHAFAGSDESSHIAFASGSSALQGKAQDKLQSLAKALLDRPALKLDISARADMDYDSAGLKQQALQRKLKVLKSKDLIADGESVASVDALQIAPAEYQKYLARVYAQENLPGKPRNFIGMARKLPPEQMEALLLQHIAVKDEDIRALANRRAQDVKDYLVEKGQVPSERLFIVGGGNGKNDGKLPAARVDFVLGAR